MPISEMARLYERITVSRGNNPEDSILDEIDSLVDWQLSGGDQSDSFHGRGYRDEHPCSWCGEGFHFLPITKDMQAMRHGSYATDEFGIGIVDPDYDYRTDESAIICPGSEWRGPPTSDAEWKWAKQKWGRPLAHIYESGGQSSSRYIQSVEPSLPPGRRRRLRFIGPFDPWTISLDDERTIERDPIGRPRVVAQSLIATFEHTPGFHNMSHQWIIENADDIQEQVFTADGHFCTMTEIKIPFVAFHVHGENPRAEFPDYVEFETTYPIERHPWMMPFWETQSHDCCDECSGVFHHLDHGECNSGAAAMAQAELRQGHESDIVIIDEAYQHDNERLRQHVEEAPITPGTSPGSVIGWTTQEAADEDQRRQAVLRSSQEAEEGWVRQVDAREQSR